MSGSKTTRARRSKSDMERLKTAIYEVVAQHHPMTVRQVFYQLVSASAINKSEAEYNNVVVRLLTLMRKAGELPFHWIADNSRWMRKPRTYAGLGDLLDSTAELYRRDVLQHQPVDIEVWLEKEALSGVLYPETSRYDVPLMVTRGYPSLTFLHSAAAQLDIYRPTYLFYFGDHDPSGVDISRHVEQSIIEMAPQAEVHFERVAVSPDQIMEMGLPTRPTKKTDTRAKSFTGQSVEVDAIPPETLREMVRSAIEWHIDRRALNTLKVVEDSERAYLQDLAHRFHEGEGGEP